MKYAPLYCSSDVEVIVGDEPDHFAAPVIEVEIGLQMLSKEYLEAANLTHKGKTKTA